MHQVTPAHTFHLDGARVIARPQACITNGHQHQEQRDHAHLLHPHWLSNAGDQRLATKALSMPPDFIVSPLHRVVRGNSLAAYRIP
jgi:hypothetical protein